MLEPSFTILKPYLRTLLILGMGVLSAIPLTGQDSTDYKAWYVGALGGAGYYYTIFNPGIPGDGGGISPVFGVAARFESPARKSIEFELRYRRGGWSEANGAYEREMQMLLG